jgi:tryptophan synthase alpha chain
MGCDRYAAAFSRLKGEKRPGFIPFTVMGDPGFRASLDVVRAFVDNGADILELGLPFSDPIADGPVNQKAGMRSLAAGMDTRLMMRFIREVRRFTDIPIGVLCYYNPVLQYGPTRFYADLAGAGADSVLVADAAVEEADGLCRAAAASAMGTVFMLSELSGPSRIKKSAEKTSAFIYLVSRLGVTGVRRDMGRSLRPTLARVRRATRRPVCVGFGISTPAHVRQVRSEKVEGIICGSAIVKRIEENLDHRRKMTATVAAFVRSMRKACG